MEFIMDMVHHNPGEAPTETAFLNPVKLREYGYRAQVFKHINRDLRQNNGLTSLPRGLMRKSKGQKRPDLRCIITLICLFCRGHW